MQIPKSQARRIGIYNSNKLDAIYEFNCNSTDGYLTNVILKASGCSVAGDIYAKQFQGSGNLQLLGSWLNYIDAKEGDNVRITWETPTDIIIERL